MVQRAVHIAATHLKPAAEPPSVGPSDAFSSIPDQPEQRNAMMNAISETIVQHPRVMNEARVACMTLQTPVDMDAVELVRLYNAISAATAGRSGAIVQFVSSSIGGSSTEMAYSAAWIGATLLGKRILFIDASQGTGKAATLPSIQTTKRLYDVALGHAGVEEAIVRQANLGLFVATLQHERLGGDSILAAQQVKGLLNSLRSSFDMIMIAPPPALEQPLAAILTAFVDGSVLVMEAGRSHCGAEAQSVDLLTSGGSPILGAVLNHRRNYVPRWLRRWL
jgi:Mrp family chromosome partitioning ATPase